ncbi:hypothetical protein PHMEG_00039446 [Phytophthora megakarya]|uniref:Non-haem dioxygenase N-terminal domain-containing protein n=1 Tax=Phytophthora megakarya TaxID=4795 RepID=A0A225UF20_9STRA|nr:hypothetical protein PHMEG_00039446 [Phytophthora megakarya]
MSSSALATTWSYVTSMWTRNTKNGELHEIIEDIRTTASEWGFFYIANHGLSEQKVGEFRAGLHSFFLLLKEVKRTIRRSATNSQDYVEGKLMKNKTDWKECFDFAGNGEQGPATDKFERLGEDQNQWLDEETLYGFHSEMRSYYVLENASSFVTTSGVEVSSWN